MTRLTVETNIDRQDFSEDILNEVIEENAPGAEISYAFSYQGENLIILVEGEENSVLVKLKLDKIVKQYRERLDEKRRLNYAEAINSLQNKMVSLGQKIEEQKQDIGGDHYDSRLTIASKLKRLKEISKKVRDK